MKWMTILFIGIESVIFGIINQANAEIINGDFETGDFSGWEINIPMGARLGSDSFSPVGTIDIIDPPTISIWEGVGGTNFARIGTGNDGPYDLSGENYITISQSIELDSYDQLSGTVFFYSGDYQDQDIGWVKIFDDYGNEVATPWIKYSGQHYQEFRDPDIIWSSEVLEYEYITRLTQWEWDTTATGSYTLVLGMTARSDNEFGSYTYFDNIIQTKPVPEPLPEPDTPGVDSDGDGIDDHNDGCPNDPNKSQPEICGCGNLDIDADRDQMMDCWEELYGLNVLIDDSKEDLDKDGYSNIVEYRDNTIPNDPSSYKTKSMPWLFLLLGGTAHEPEVQ